MREICVGLPRSLWRRCRLQRLQRLQRLHRLQQLGAVGVCVVSVGCGDASRPETIGLPNTPEGAESAEGPAQADAGSTLSGGVGEAANTFRCGNWADQKDNFVNGDLLLSGLASTDSYEAVLAKSDRILAEFQRTANVNAIRLPINEPTALGDAWLTYKGAIDAAIQRKMRVIVAYWAWQKGKADDAARFDAMWDRVIDTYRGEELVYFEIMNEPWAYSIVGPFIDIEVAWLARHADVPRGRMVIAGSWSDQEVRVQGADPRLDGTLLSVHIYPFNKEMRTVTQEWKDALDYNVGGHGSRVIVTEWGAPMTSGTDYSGPGDGDHETAFMTGVSSYLQDNDIGSCYWPLLRTADAWSLTTLGGDAENTVLSVNNATGLARVQSAFRLAP
jgi:endoglucanase